MTLATAKLLVGRTIVAVDLRSWMDETDAGRKIGKIHEPVFTLDNGARITFRVQETDNGSSYGVCPNYHPKEKP